MRWGNNVENGGISDGHDHWDEPTTILMNIIKVWWVKTTRMLKTLMITIVLTSYLEIGVASSHKHLCGLWLVCTIMHINIKFGGLQSKHCQHLWGAIERKTRKIYRKEITQVTKQWPTSSGIVSYFSSSWDIVLLGSFLDKFLRPTLRKIFLWKSQISSRFANITDSCVMDDYLRQSSYRQKTYFHKNLGCSLSPPSWLSSSTLSKGH